MTGFFSRLFGKRERRAPKHAAEALNELQDLRLEIEEKRVEIEDLRQELERQRTSGIKRADLAAGQRIEKLMTSLSGPLVQLATQAYIFEVEKKPLELADVLVVIRQVFRQVEESGLTLEGDLGSRTAYDPERHQLLSAAACEPGGEVEIRFAGASFNGKLLLKAGVSKV